MNNFLKIQIFLKISLQNTTLDASLCWRGKKARVDYICSISMIPTVLLCKAHGEFHRHYQNLHLQWSTLEILSSYKLLNSSQRLQVRNYFVINIIEFERSSHIPFFKAVAYVADFSQESWVTFSWENKRKYNKKECGFYKIEFLITLFYAWHFIS